MPVYIVAHTNRNGASHSRPVVAQSAAEALELREGELGIVEHDPAFTVTVTERPDLDGHYEALLVDGERRRRIDEWCDRR